MAKKKQSPKTKKVPIVKTAKTWNGLPGFDFYVDTEHLAEHKFWVNATVAKALDTLRYDGKAFVVDVVETNELKKKRVVTQTFSAWLDEYARPL